MKEKEKKCFKKVELFESLVRLVEASEIKSGKNVECEMLFTFNREFWSTIEEKHFYSFDFKGYVGIFSKELLNTT